MHRRILPLAILALAATRPLAAQQGPEAGQAIARADTVARDWLALLAQGNAQAAWDRAAPIFRERRRYLDWEAFVSRSADDFRRPDPRRLVESRFIEEQPPFPRTWYVNLRYLTDRGDLKRVGEFIVLEWAGDDDWRVTEYRLFPNAEGTPVLPRGDYAPRGGRPAPAPAPAPEPPQNIAPLPRPSPAPPPVKKP